MRSCANISICWLKAANGLLKNNVSSTMWYHSCVESKIFNKLKLKNNNTQSYRYRGQAGAAAKSLQLCLTLCDPKDGSPSGSPVPVILQARTLEWVAISFSSPSKWKVKVKSLSLVWLLETPWTAAHQAPLSMGFSRQEHWSGVPLPSPRGEASGYQREEAREEGQCSGRRLWGANYYIWNKL